jgi:DNA-binding transcriptional regulator YiaG
MAKKDRASLAILLAQPPTDDVAPMLKAWREHAQLSQTEAADRLGVSVRTLQGWEFGRPMANPRLLRVAIENNMQAQLELEPKAIVEEFCTLCTSIRSDFDLYRSLFETDRRSLNLYTAIAPLCFGDLSRVLSEHLFLQFSKITDPAKMGNKFNLTTNYIVEEILWPDEVGRKLREVNERLKSFRQYIEPARSKRIAHVDLSAQVERWGNLGAFPKGADTEFLLDLQSFVNIAFGHFNGGQGRPIAITMSTDTHQLVKALEKSVVFDRCSKCDGGERATAVLDFTTAILFY